MMDLPFLPTLNASLNALSAMCLLLGFYFIKIGEKRKHKFCMISAFVVSSIFLISYLYYHFSKVGITRFQGTGIARYVYLTILTSHSFLAVVNLPMVLITINHAFRERFDKHRRIAPVTFFLWLYVSVTGVIVYLMLYVCYVV